ncbi:flagellar protein G [Halorarum halophilum]|uniref:Flagellar protein G n=1 Tax=Halorarum halophilum TaxID=2743090 RepID=A0A7D5K8P9_9EURY|nr:CARDB domain-containing protein [Halobaculum halophilum]QLG28459.1 flagellar protein G [Halobaculum halophilum]
MASGGVAEMVLFIAALLVAASVAGTLTSEVTRIGDAISDRSLDVASDVRTDVEIVSDPATGVYNASGNDNVTVYVRNTGSSSLLAEPSTFDVLLDGTYQGDVSVAAMQGGAMWHEGEVVELTIRTTGLDPGDHRLKLVVNNDEEVLIFRT